MNSDDTYVRQQDQSNPHQLTPFRNDMVAHVNESFNNFIRWIGAVIEVEIRVVDASFVPLFGVIERIV